MDQMRRFGTSFGAEKVHAISGKPVDITPCLYRMVWLRENEPHLLDRAAYIAEVHGYLCFRLTGRWTTSTASADPMGVLDMERLVCSQDILAAAGVPIDKMLPLVRPGAFIGTVIEAAAQATGLAADTPVFAAGGDGQCAGTGVEVLRSGRAYINLRTAVVSGSYAERYAFDAAFRTETAVADRGYILETCLRAGTFLVDWLSRELLGIDPQRRLEALTALEAEAGASPVGANGVILVPYWEGCMTPYRNAAARGVIAGLSGSTRRGDLYRALLEGVALEQALASRRLQGGVLSGRGNRGRHGMQLVPELCRGIGRHGRPYRSDLRTEAEGEGGLRGIGRDIQRTLASALKLEPQARSLCRAAGCKAAFLMGIDPLVQSLTFAAALVPSVVLTAPSIK
jgi:xylulokinase